MRLQPEVSVVRAASTPSPIPRQLLPPAPPFCAPQVKLLDLGSPFSRKANVVAYDRHVLFTSNDPTGATRHRTPCPISTTRIDEAFVHKMPEELVGLVFAQANLIAYVCEFGVGIYLVPSALAPLDRSEHRFALVIGKLCRHYAPLPLVPPPALMLPDRIATPPPPAPSLHGQRAGHKCEITVWRLVQVPTRATVLRTGPAAIRCVRDAAFCRRRARSDSTSGAPRRGGTAGADAASLLTTGKSLVALHDWTFLLGPGFFVGVGNGLILGYLMYTSRLVPRGMAVLGLIAGPLIIASGVGVLLGVIEAGGVVQDIATIPEFFWELSLGIWLTVRGFNPSAIARLEHESP